VGEGWRQMGYTGMGGGYSLLKKGCNILFLLCLLSLSSCTSLGYDSHTKALPPQDGRLITISLNPNPPENSVKLPLYAIEEPVNHEAGWDDDDLVLVYKSSLIKENSSLQWSWCSDSWWTKSRLRSGTILAYGGSFSARIRRGEIRIYCGSRGQFLVNLKTIYLSAEQPE